MLTLLPDRCDTERGYRKAVITCKLSCYSSAAPAAQQFAAIPAQTAWQPCSYAALQPCSCAALQPCSRAAVQPCSRAAVQPCSLAAVQPCSLTALQHQFAAWQPQATALQLYSLTVLRSQ